MQKTWLGHPRGLATLFFTEMWERFSFLGVRALLVLYLVGSTQRPGLGFSESRAGTIFGIYAFLAYALGIPGGWIADKWLGPHRAVLFGGIIIALGHFSMALPGLVTFFAGLGLIVSGTGLLKPNVSTLVGALYERDDPRRDAGFSLFYMGINLGGVLSPLICSYLAQRVGWRIGFGAAGIGMVFGLVQYLAGQKHLPASVRRAETAAAAAPAREPNEWPRLAVIGILTLFAVVFWAAFEQAGTSLTLFADRATRLTIAGFTYPPGWFLSLNPLFVILGAPLFAWLWLRLGPRQPSTPAKFAISLALHAIAFLFVLPAALSFERDGLRVSPLWLVAFYVLQTASELCLSPVGLSMVTRLAPARMAGSMMGLWFFATAMGSYLAGWYAGRLQHLPFFELFRTAFFVTAAVTVVLIALVRPIKRLMGS